MVQCTTGIVRWKLYTNNDSPFPSIRSRIYMNRNVGTYVDEAAAHRCKALNDAFFVIAYVGGDLLAMPL